MRHQLSRLAPLSALIFFVLFVIVIALPSSPNAKASAAKAVTFFTHHRHQQLSIAFLLWYAMLFFVFFGASLRSHLRARGSSDGLVALGFIGTAFYAVAVSVLAGLLYAAADVPTKISPSAEQALNVLQNDLFPLIFVGTAMFMFGNGLAIVRAQAKALPKWLGWVALLIGLIAVVPPLSFFSFFAMVVWTPIVGILIYLREREPAQVTAAVPQPSLT